MAMTRPMIGHRSAAFKEFWTSIAARLPRGAAHRRRRHGRHRQLDPGHGERRSPRWCGEDVLHLANGAFSERWFAISQRARQARRQSRSPGARRSIPTLVRAALRRKHYDAVTLVHNETSTGVISPFAEVARVVREESDALILVDTVSSLGGAPVETDAWGLDVVLAGTQKAIAVPPGLTVFTLSERAAERAARGAAPRLLHRSPALPRQAPRGRLHHHAGDPAALRARHAARPHPRRGDGGALGSATGGSSARTAEWAAERGLDLRVRRGRPVGDGELPEAAARACGARSVVQGLAERGFTIGGGYGDWKPTTFRIGHMGEVRESDLEALLAAARRSAGSQCTAS